MNNEELMQAGEQVVKMRGRGGVNNFNSNIKAIIATEAQREIAKQLLEETLSACRSA